MSAFYTANPKKKSVGKTKLPSRLGKAEAFVYGIAETN
jgi:hypothetical protein